MEKKAIMKTFTDYLDAYLVAREAIAFLYSQNEDDREVWDAKTKALEKAKAELNLRMQNGQVRYMS